MQISRNEFERDQYKLLRPIQVIECVCVSHDFSISWEKFVERGNAYLGYLRSYMSFKNMNLSSTR